MKYGLSEEQLKQIQDIISSYVEIEEAVLFGSRALDTYKEASDVDIAIKGMKVTASLAAKLKYHLEEDTYLPFFFDLVAYPTITNESLKKHIDTKGVSIYRAGWKECKLGDVADVQTGPFGSQLHQRDYQVVGTPIITVEHVINNRINHSNLSLISDYDKQRLIKYILKEGDVVFSRVGSVDRCAYVGNNEDGWLFSGRLLRVRVDPLKASSRFISFYFSQDSFKETIRRIAVGATMPSINTEILSRVDILLPPLSEQKAIAAVLSCLDDKIDLLHRQNKTLEVLAETLFRRWFVDEADERWEEGKFPDEFDYTMGVSPPGQSYNETGEGVPMYQGNADFEFRFPKRRVFTNDPKRFAEKFDSLISVRAPVGAQNMAEEKCCIGRGVAAFRYKRNNGYYTYTYFKMKSLIKEIEQFNHTGTVFGSISKADFEELSVSVPPIEYVDAYQKETKPIDDRVISNCIQIRTLEKLRDTLLPKLISGEVRVEL